VSHISRDSCHYSSCAYHRSLPQVINWETPRGTLPMLQKGPQWMKPELTPTPSDVFSSPWGGPFHQEQEATELDLILRRGVGTPLCFLGKQVSWLVQETPVSPTIAVFISFLEGPTESPHLTFMPRCFHS